MGASHSIIRAPENPSQASHPSQSKPGRAFGDLRSVTERDERDGSKNGDGSKDHTVTKSVTRKPLGHKACDAVMDVTDFSEDLLPDDDRSIDEIMTDTSDCRFKRQVQ